MSEYVEEEEGEGSLDIGRYLGIVKRRWLHFVIPMFCVWLLVWGSSWLIKPLYRSSTLILVERPTMPKSIVEPNINDDLQDRLQSITQQILSRTRLLTIIDEFKLYRGEGRTPSEDELVSRMRKDIEIELVRDARNNEITAFHIYYSARDPKVAQQVTSELTNLFINENLRVRQEQSEETTKFLADQLEQARQHLADQEAKVKAFQATHSGALPDQQTSNLQILGGLQSQLQNEQGALNSARQQRTYLQSMLEQNRSARPVTRSADGSVSNVATLDQELDKLRAQLTDLNSRYTDQYPDVQKLKQQIAKTQQLRDQLAAKSASVKDNDAGLSADPTIAQLQSQLKANQLEIANRERTVSFLTSRIGEYQARLNEQPATEQQLADLTRGYDQSKANYDDLLKKMNDSRMATSMEQMRQGERFTMLDRPSLPQKPDYPNRIKFCGFGLAGGIALGFLIAGAFEFLDDRVYSDAEIKKILPLAVIAEVPEVLKPAAETDRKKQTRLRWGVTVFVLLVIAAGAAISALS